MPIFIDIVKIILGLVALYFGAEWLVYGSSKIALKLKISQLVIGLTVVAFGTSSPELAVSIEANFSGNIGIAIGNIVGSNICNIALIIGAGSLLHSLPFQKKLILRDLPLLLVVSVVFFLMVLWGNNISRLEGWLLFVTLIFYLYYLYKKRENLDVEEIESDTDKEKSYFTLIAIIVVSLFLLVLGSDFLLKGSVGIASKLGVSEALIGLSLVAFGTSLPELATVIVASYRKHFDLIIGNAIGSCLFNILAVIGISAGLKSMNNISFSYFDFAVMIFLSLVVYIIGAWRKEISRKVGIGFLSFYILYILFIFLIQKTI